MIGFLKFYIKTHVNIVFFSILIALFLFPKVNLAEADTYCGNTLIPDVDCGSFYSNLLATGDPCNNAIFNLNCSQSIWPWDTKYTGTECVHQTYPGYSCMGCYNGGATWEGKYCRHTCSFVAQKQQCNSAGTAWVNATSNVCVSYSSCDNSNLPDNPYSCNAPPISPPPPITSPPPPACNFSDADGLGYYETCTGTGGPIKDACDTATSYKLTFCDTASGCYYGSSVQCPSGQLCRIINNGSPECYNAFVTIQGRNVDINNNTLTTYIGQSISISPKDGDATGVRSGASYPGAWSFSNISAGTYTVTATPPTNYTVYYSYSGKNTSPTAVYKIDNTLSVTLLNDNDQAEINFKYVLNPVSVTIKGKNVDAAGTALTTDIGQQISISGGSPPITTIRDGSAYPGVWNFTNIPGGIYTVTAAIPTDYAVSYSYGDSSGPKKNFSPPTANYILSNSLSVDLPINNDLADIYFKYIPTLCQVTTVPAFQALEVGGTGTVTASVTYGLGASTIKQMRFGFYNTAVATATSPDLTSPYSTTTRGISPGNTAVWATADLDDNGDGIVDRTCQTTGATDTNITVIPPGGPTPTPIPPTPTPILYSISGNVFNDANGNRYSIGETFSGTVSVSLTGKTATYPGSTGGYLISNLPAGQYTVTFLGTPIGLPANWIMTEPTSGFSFTVTVGGAGGTCALGGSLNAQCVAGNISNLNFGIKNTSLYPSPWFQSVGADVRWDSGIAGVGKLMLPTNQLASIPGTGGMSGIIFSGITSPFGSQTVSIANWVVGGSATDKREVFTDTHSAIPSSYRFLSETADGAGIVPTAVASLTNISSQGIYKIEGPLNVSADYTFGSGNFVILIHGDLNINNKITVPIGSTAIFSASGNITVGPTVAEIQGLYSADNNFTVNSTGSCPDIKLNVAGTVVANAGRTGGTFIINRTLCAGNLTNPSITLTERPDFMINYPSIVTQTNRLYQDIAP